MTKISKTENEWKKILTKQEYHVLREKGTEPAFSGKYLDNKKKGIYICAGCGNELFDSSTKFTSGTGWPSFWVPISNNKLSKNIDNRFGIQRTEVVCKKCGGHLGHVFEDSTTLTKKRYCINSVSLKFLEKK